ncbi:MAG: beta-ketoacyl-ACP synthase III [Sulfuricurvum sp.]|uniref:beta-ketoacyl-ACP synthase III n=1 Tax=Sulfuricurvum sp. TaxID=2025608 RepID=UPI0026107B06|nr:beta-ketoacyl-ACP synthase III [Sulfuricurvum sp.]MDD2829444.1 beta-ketoacyl-ACP synthase III [Sulfuricurvum sp.]MDD4948473.1 beta-ketoacyl-ACP synthase III [Sulfuricurvum sp.]
MANVYITKIAAFLPNDPVDNAHIEEVLGCIGGVKSRAKNVVLRSNGIKTRHYVLDPKTREPLYSNASLTAKAIRLLEDEKFSLSDVGCLVCGTTSPDHLMPNHALMTQGELGLHACEAIATSGICLSGVTAMKYAYMAIASEEHACAISSGSETSSMGMRAEMFMAESGDAESVEKRPEIAFGKDFLRWMLSDGAGATLLQPTPNSEGISLKIEWIDILSYAGEMPVCMIAGAHHSDEGVYQPWKEVHSSLWREYNVFAVEQDVKLLNENIVHYTVEKPLLSIKEKRQLCADDIDYFLPHYSSEYFRDKMAAGMEKIGFAIPYEKWFTNLTTKGNTGSASIYIILEELFNSGKLQVGEKILCFIPESGRFSTAFMLLEVV